LQKQSLYVIGVLVSTRDNAEISKCSINRCRSGVVALR